MNGLSHQQQCDKRRAEREKENSINQVCASMPHMRRGCDSRFAAQQRRKAKAILLRKAVPAPRLVGIEPNPGPNRRQNRNRGAAKGAKKKKAQQPRRRPRANRAGAKSLPSKRATQSGNQAYLKARYGEGMRSVTDGISIMKTIHNGSTIEDTFQVRREKVKNIVGSTGSTLTINSSFYLNPGNQSLFPIFSQIAATYAEYRVNTLVLSYETEAYAASGSSVSAGKVILATNYDPKAALFTSDQAMENEYNSDRGAPYSELVHDVLEGEHALKSDPLKNYFVYSSANAAAPTGTDSKFCDVGLFQLGTQGTVDGTSEIGELYVTYSFTMIRPQQPVSGNQLLQAHIVESAAGTAAAAGSAFLGTTGGVLRAGSTLPCVMTSNTFTLPAAGTFFVSAVWAGSVAAVPTFSPGTNITLIQQLEDNLANKASAVSSNITVGLWWYNVTAAGTGTANTVTITGLTSLASGTADIIISQIGSGLLEPRDPFRRLDVETRDELTELRSEVQEMRRFLHSIRKPRVAEIDSDFEDEQKQPLSQSSSSSSTSSSDPMSQSLLGIVGDYVARKSASQKKQ